MKERFIKFWALIRPFFTAKKIKELILGGIFVFVNTAVNFAAYGLLLSAKINIYAAQAVAMCFKKAADLLLTRRYIYKRMGNVSAAEWRRFFSFLPFSLTISLFGIYLFHSILGFDPLQAKVLAFVAGMSFNAFFRPFVFSGRPY